MLRRWIYWTVPICAAFTSCNLIPKYSPPSVALPEQWQCASKMEFQEGSPECFCWWAALNDPVLNQLLQCAASQNLNLCMAALRIKEARAMASGGAARLYPHIDATAACGHAAINKKLVNKLIGNHCYKSGIKQIDYFEAGFDAEWEIDIFGLSKYETNTLQAQVEASEHEYKHIWISLSAEIAKNYVELRGWQARRQLIQKNIASLNDTLSLMESLIATGFADAADQKLAEQQLYNYQAQEPPIQLAIQQASNKLSVLLGYPPGELDSALNSNECAGLPVLPNEKPMGIPSELLRRRPDIQKAERELAAAYNQVGSAIAALFPRLSLTGFIGELAALSTGSFAWYAGPSILMPVFNSKLLQNDVKINKLKTEQAFYHYHQVVLEAMEETENALLAFHYEQERTAKLAQARQASREAYSLTFDLYHQGFKNYLNVQAANQSLLQAEDNYLQSQIKLLVEYIVIYKAMGGGWRVAVEG